LPDEAQATRDESGEPLSGDCKEANVTHQPEAGARDLRRAIERRSATPLVFLHQLPRWVLPLALVVLLIAGMIGTGLVGAAALLVLAALLGWLTYLSWPSTSPAGRVLRIAAFILLVLLAAGHGFGRF